MITTDRDRFVGFHLTKENKDALKKEAERQGISMSQLLSNLMDSWLPLVLKKRQELESKPTEEDVPLPFEGVTAEYMKDRH